MRPTRPLGLVAASVFAAAGLAAGGADSPSGAPASSRASASTATAADAVEVKDFSFGPEKLTVTAGSKVTWTFDDSAQHTVRFAQPKVTSKALADGQTFSYTFNTPGTYDYICSIHQYMHGTIVVKSPS
jgi:plastocyanin